MHLFSFVVLLAVTLGTAGAMPMPSFGQQFVTYIVTYQNGTSNGNYTMMLDFPNQRVRYDYPHAFGEPDNATQLWIYGNTMKSYFFGSNDGKQTDCATVGNVTDVLQKFSFYEGFGTKYNGTVDLNGIKCYQWNLYSLFGSITDTFWITVEQPYKPVRHYSYPYSEGQYYDPSFDMWYYDFCYNCFVGDPFAIPTDLCPTQ
eukprot:TRINITY_DN4241_c0_g1_i1.p1 TRINITY_DN4241_c0_g1~~TRINITY_DN4241_c0_g1_i1.p1  ORF type:complete len:201 (+),score=9.42 TRINITY_DN4241_c0_g1_i1:102-704(+)